MVNAIKEFQKDVGPADRRAQSAGARHPSDTAKKKQEASLEDRHRSRTGVRLGIPTKLVPQQTSDANATK